MSTPPTTSLILASSSPRRRDLLSQHGYRFSMLPADVNEISPPHFTPGETVLYNARSKARAVARLHLEALVVGVDTVVAFEGEVFGKPSDMDAAFAMASRLNGRTHEVYSGVWLCRMAAGRERGFIEVTRVHFRRLSERQLRDYLTRIGPLDKAGAYAAQDDNGELIDRVEGSFSNVVGLPMESFERELRRFE